MLLKDFLNDRRIHIGKFADAAGIPRPRMYKISCGEISITKADAVRVEIATKGKVSRQEALWPEDFAEKNEDGCFVPNSEKRSDNGVN